MRKKKQELRFLLPSLKQEYLGKNGVSVKSFFYRTELTKEDILEELHSLKHMKPLLEQLSPSRSIYLLSGDSEEQLQLAAEYILHYHLLVNDADYNEQLFYDKDEEEEAQIVNGIHQEANGDFYYDFSKKAPVIQGSDLLWSNDSPEFLPFGAIGYGMERKKSPLPWWTELSDEPLCIQLSNDFLPEHQLVKQLQSLSEKGLRIIWRCIPPFETIREDAYDHFMENLGFHLECEPIFLKGPDENSAYKQQALRQFAKDRGYSFAGGDTVKEVLNQIRMSRHTVENETLRKAVGNAIIRRKKKTGSSRLTAADFHFLRRPRSGGAFFSEQIKDTFIGQEEIRSQLNSIIQQMLFQKRRNALALPSEPTHKVMAFIGPPGTGKTSWAKHLAKQMQSLGLLDFGDILCINAAELKAKYVGHTTHRIRSIFQEYGVIILDEAYSLAMDGKDDDTFSREALAQLCVELENIREGQMVIFAGYGNSSHSSDNPMLRFIESNPGISSRISHKVFFADFEPKQLVEVFHSMLQNEGYVAATEADGELEQYFRLRMGSRGFGNCREARNLADRTKNLMALRLQDITNLNQELATHVLTEDIRTAIAEIQREYDSLSAGKGIIGGF